MHTLGILHDVGDAWLPRTLTWVYTQVTKLPPDIESHVLCRRTENLDQFAFPRILESGRESRFRRALDRLARVTGLDPSQGPLRRLALRSGARVLHSHFGYVGFAGLAAARALRLRHVVTFYGFDASSLPVQQPIWRERYLDLFSTADRVLCEGPHFAKTIAALGCAPEKIVVHHLGVPLEQIPWTPRAYSPDRSLRVLIASSFVEKKGIPDALEAIGRCAREFPIDVTVIGDVVAGFPPSAVEKTRILEVVGRHGLGERVRWLGYQPLRVLHEEARRHDLFLSPSRVAADGSTEGGAPVTLIEMAASGLAIVSTRHCDIPEVVLDGRTGLLAPEGDPAALAEHLRWFRSHPERWAEMSRAGRAHVEAEFSADTQGVRLGALYRAVDSEVRAI